MQKLNTSFEIRKDRLILRKKEELVSIWQHSKSKLQLFHHEPLFWNFPNTVSVFILQYSALKHLAAVNMTAGQNPAGKKESIINKSSKKYFYRAYNTEISFKGTYQMSDKYCNALFVFFLLVFTPLMIEKEMAY